MPARYLEIKQSLKERGMDEAEAKSSAARIYNSSRRHDEPPLTPNYEKTHGVKSKNNSRKKK